MGSSYNGTSDLQLERMNVYFNEVSVADIIQMAWFCV
jgi:hypothetical protein